MNDNVILSLEGLSAGYGGSNTISNINLSLTAGEALCVVGQSGCGKSTLLKSVIGGVRQARYNGRRHCV